MPAIVRFDSSGAATLQEILEWFRDDFKDNNQIFVQTTKALQDYRDILRQLRDPEQNQTEIDIQQHYELLQEVMNVLTADVNTLHIFKNWANINLRSDPTLPESLNAESFKTKIQEYIQTDVKKALIAMKQEIVKSAKRVKRTLRVPTEQENQGPSHQGPRLH